MDVIGIVGVGAIADDERAFDALRRRHLRAAAQHPSRRLRDPHR